MHSRVALKTADGALLAAPDVPARGIAAGTAAAGAAAEEVVVAAAAEGAAVGAAAGWEA